VIEFQVSHQGFIPSSPTHEFIQRLVLGARPEVYVPRVVSCACRSNLCVV
jgi:hypothetical protein